LKLLDLRLLLLIECDREAKLFGHLRSEFWGIDAFELWSSPDDHV